MVKAGGRLYAVMAHAIYLVQLAEQIDPDRKNPNLPHMSRKVMSYGADDEFVTRTIVTAHELTRNGLIRDGFPLDDFLQKILDATKILAEMRSAIDGFQKLRESIDATIGDGLEADRTVKLPSIGDPHRFCVSFNSSMGHFAQLQFDCLLQGLGVDIVRGHWAGLTKLAGEKLGEDHPFATFMRALAPVGLFIRNARNCVEHPKEGSEIRVTNYDLHVDGYIVPPTIEVNHPDTPEPQVDIVIFINGFFETCVVTLEQSIVHIIENDLRTFGPMEFHVDYVAEKSDKENVRYRIQMYGRDTV
jgi:hypothetical protein